MALFIEYLAETGSVSEAAKQVGMSRQSAYMIRSRLIGQPFDFAWEGALEFGIQQLAHTVLDRCLNGTPVPVFYKGEQVGEKRVFNERATFNILDRMSSFGRLHYERDMASRRWREMTDRLRAGPIIWTDEERHGTDPNHPMNMTKQELDDDIAYQADQKEKWGESDARTVKMDALGKEINDFMTGESHYHITPKGNDNGHFKPKRW